MSVSEIVNKIWNYAHVLRDDGVGYSDYVEQITYLIFLKMTDERQQSWQEIKVPKKYVWTKLLRLDGCTRKNMQVNFNASFSVGEL